MELMPQSVDISTVDMWIQNESRISQQGSLSRIWSPTGTRHSKVSQQQFISAYIYGAACSRTGDSFGLTLPTTNTLTMLIYRSSICTHK